VAFRVSRADRREPLLAARVAASVAAQVKIVISMLRSLQGPSAADAGRFQPRRARPLPGTDHGQWQWSARSASCPTVHEWSNARASL